MTRHALQNRRSELAIATSGSLANRRVTPTRFQHSEVVEVDLTVAIVVVDTREAGVATDAAEGGHQRVQLSAINQAVVVRVAIDDIAPTVAIAVLLIWIRR